MEARDGDEFEPRCPCGYENFERIVVERTPGARVVTDFVACVGCRANYSPAPKQRITLRLPPEPLPPPTPPEPPRAPLPPNHGMVTLQKAPYVPEGWVDPAKRKVEAVVETVVKPSAES